MKSTLAALCCFLASSAFPLTAGSDRAIDVRSVVEAMSISRDAVLEIDLAHWGGLVSSGEAVIPDLVALAIGHEPLAVRNTALRALIELKVSTAKKQPAIDAVFQLVESGDPLGREPRTAPHLAALSVSTTDKAKRTQRIWWFLNHKDDYFVKECLPLYLYIASEPDFIRLREWLSDKQKQGRTKQVYLSSWKTQIAVAEKRLAARRGSGR